MRSFFTAFVAALSLSCGASPPPATHAGKPVSEPEIELVESAPVETTLDHADVRDAWQVWLEMIRGAERTLDIAEFYVSDGSRLSPILAAIEAAAGRGVQVRVLVDSVFAPKYPESLERLGRVPGIEVRRIEVGKLSGGVMHAKYFIVDGRDAYEGSQNFDWRSLEHIQEMGLRVRVPSVVSALGDVFATDWDLAGGGPRDARHKSASPRADRSFRAVASPRGWLPDESTWDLPQLVALLDGAKTSIHLQVLTYKAASRDGSPFTELDAALRRAAARNVAVELLVSDWNRKPEARPSVDALATVPGITVRYLTIPPASSGPIPFARVAHAKYLVLDGVRAWVGTSNWEGDYFLRTRNVGVILEKGPIPARLELIFRDGWTSAYAAAW
jgi:phosphatidylserine/phosphatidylglycerophosphate/cardiolipin synthase-like enzyme